MEWLQRKKFSIRDFFSGTDNSESGKLFCFLKPMLIKKSVAMMQLPFSMGEEQTSKLSL